MSEVERLGGEQLEHLERLLAKQGAPIVQCLQPPASPKALAAVESYLSLPLPNELKQWWGWHDGTNPDVYGSAAILIGPFFTFMNSQRSITATQERREMAKEIDSDEPETYWGSTWLALGTSGVVSCQCAVESNAPVPVLDVDYHKAAYPGAVVCHSLGEMVRWWIEALESGAWRYDKAQNYWERTYELIPPERDQSGLV